MPEPTLPTALPARLPLAGAAAGPLAQTAPAVAAPAVVAPAAAAPAAAAPAAAPGRVVIPGPTMGPDSYVAAGTLVIGSQRFGPGQAAGGEIRALAPGVTIEEASKLTADNGMDEVFFQTEDGKAYVLFAAKANFETLKPGYFGRFEGRKAKIVAVNDEANTFSEGSGSVWHWLANVGRNAVGNEASRTVTTMVTTAAGSFVAAAAMKGAPAAAAVAAPAVAGAATAGAAGGAVAGKTVLGFVGTASSRVVGGVSSILNALGGIALAGAIAFGVASIIGGLMAAKKKSDATTIDMITGRF